MQTAHASNCQELLTAVTNWNNLMKGDLANLNGELAKHNLSPVAAEALTAPSCGQR